MIPMSLFVFVNICQIICSSSFVENDSIVFPSENDTSQADISNKLKECINDNFKIEFIGECHSLLTTEGVCPEGQWLVLDQKSASLPRPKILGHCVLRRCNDTNSQHYWVQSRRCVHVNASSTFCPKGNVLSTDYFGDGYCKCREQPVQAKYRDGSCFPVYKQGPCPANSTWVEVNNRGQCKGDSCHALRQQFPNKTIVPWSDGKCYAVDERGPCRPGLVVQIHPWSKSPECGENYATLNLISPPCVGADHSGRCTHAVKTPQNQFISQVADQVSKKRNKKSSPK